MIMGGGRIGLNLAKRLESTDIQVKLIEINEERCNYLTEELDETVILHGDAGDVSLLQEENISNTDVFIAVSDDDEDNMLISLLARRLGAKKVATIVNRSEYIPIASSIGIDSAISPRITTAGAILRFIRKGKVLSVNTLREDEAETMEAQALPTSAIVNKPLKKIRFPKDAIIGAIVRGGEVIIPGGEEIILPDDKVVIFYLSRSLKKVEKALAVKLEFF
jgi:trk system potassium uptake protein TrkA